MSGERHQLAGLDQRERGFSRPVEIDAAEQGFRAVLRYEQLRVESDPQPTGTAALQQLIDILHRRGFRQLKSQLSFREHVYLGSQEPWIEYADPSVDAPAPGLLSRMARWLTKRSRTEETP